MKKILSQLTILLILTCISQNISAQCNVLWPIVSGANQVITVHSRVVSGGSLTGTLIVNAGITLCLEGTGFIDVSGGFTNNGTINHNGTGRFKTSENTINNGAITSSIVQFNKANSSFSLINNNAINCADIFIQASSFTNNAGATMVSALNVEVNCDTDNYGDITTSVLFKKTTGTKYVTCHNNSNITSGTINMNYSTLTIGVGATVVAVNNIDLSGIVNNSGLIESQTGYLDKGFNSGDPLVNTATGSIKSFGNLTIEAQITNAGLIEITNAGIFEKTNSSESITNNVGGSIILRGSSSNFIARGAINNSGYILCEGDITRIASSNDVLTNSATGYIRICNDYTKKVNLTNDGLIEVGHNLKFEGSASTIIQNNSTGKIHILNNLDFKCNLNNIGGQVIVGDSLWHRNSSSSFITISDSGIVFANNYIHDNGELIGGGSASTIGFLKIEDFSQTLNTVNISGFIDINDLGHNGIAPYFDSESPVYSYPTGNISDGISLPFFADGSFTDTCSGTTISLPIELTNFNVTPIKNNLQINWQTASEINNDFFTIERSENAINWEFVSTKEGAGNSNQLINYSAVDYTPYFGVSYYRLKQTDFDGKYEYSKIKTINLVEDNSNVTIYPNPTSDGVITIKGTKQELSELSIYNILGQNINSLALITTISDKIKTIDIENLPKGVYLIKTKTIAKTIYSK